MKVCYTGGAVKDCGSYYSVATNAVELRIWFLTDDILRIRAGFDGDWMKLLQPDHDRMGVPHRRADEGLPQARADRRCRTDPMATSRPVIQAAA